MDTVIYYICVPLGYLMKWCYELLGNYGLAIVAFTLLTKLVLAPLSVWLHYNSIKMVKIQPDINFIKAKYYGDGDRIADEQATLFKKAKYRPMLSLIPLVVQIVLLLGVVEIIYNPLTYIFGLNADTVSALGAWAGANMETSAGQLEIVRAIASGGVPTVPVDATVLEGIATLGQRIGPIDLTAVPAAEWGLYILVPVVAALSSLVMCWAQNVGNVLQAEQSKVNQYGLTIFSVGLSLYLGFGVPVGIALYWVASNLLAILQQVILNACISPKKHVDYDALERSRKALADIEALDGGKKHRKKTEKEKADAKREKADYKRFFSIVNKHLVIYSEKGGFYKYFEGLIAHLLSRSNVTIHYVTNDPDDPIFEMAKTEPRIKPYYIGLKKLITLMMKMDADVVVMSTPDLDKFYVRRSLVRRDVEYIYVPHDMMSVHMGFREGALDAFDTVFSTGPHVDREVRATEQVYGLKEKTLVPFGYPLADKLIAAGDAENAERALKPTPARREILIAPSWQEDNLLDSCIDELLSQLLRPEHRVTVRPHPEYVKRYGERMNAIVEKYRDQIGEGLAFELDFTTNRSTYASDLLVTDWSGIAYEFCFATKRPALFINTQIKCMNPNWEKIGQTPVEISLRDEVGVSLDKDQLDQTAKTVAELLASPEQYERKITDVLNRHLYSIGTGGKVGATYILRRIKEKQTQKKSQKGA